MSNDGMTDKGEKEIFNNYRVEFIFDYAIISTGVFALHEDAAVPMAKDVIIDELGLTNGALDYAMVEVQLLDVDVLA